MKISYRSIALALFLASAMSTSAVAQEQPARRTAATETHTTAATPRPRLPTPSVTHHVLDLPGRSLHFTATAAATLLPDQHDAPIAEIATISYVLDGADPASRPVVFAFNGGPGFASAMVQLGGFGPWRLPMDSVPSTQALLLPNSETWLDFADLVFIDPGETGYSRIVATDDAARRKMLSVNGDAEYLAEVIRRWLEANNRLLSPKFIAGESYGGFRAPRIARILQSDQGIGVDGLILISPMLDAGGRSSAFDPLYWVGMLPTLAAVARSGSGDVSRDSLADVEAYAIGDYLHDQMQLAHDPAALARVVAKITTLTRLDPALVWRLRGRVDAATFLRNRQSGRVGSAFDATVTDPQAEDSNPWFNDPDPIIDRLAAPFTSGMLQVYHRLQWAPDALYILHNRSVNRSWDWNRSAWRAPEAVTALRVDLAVDNRMRVLIAHGLYDLVTPYFATKLILDSVPDIGTPDRLHLLCLPAGHMVYARDGARRSLRDAVKDLVIRPSETDTLVQ